MTPGPLGIPLDTCAVIHLMQGEAIAAAALDAIAQARRERGILVSPVSAWEIGLLARPGRRTPGPAFLPSPETWFERMLGFPGVRLVPLTPAIAIASSFLPGEPHGDPADRLLTAAARDLGVPIATRDGRIRAYGLAGHVKVVAC